MIAQSGLSTIYRGRDVHFGREVAIKVHQFGVNPARLFAEARLTVRLSHPGIVPVPQVNLLSDGRPFMAMNLVKGATLTHFLPGKLASRGPLVAVFEQVCQTLAYAHHHGVIHRNIKPSKVMIGAFGEVLVLGWGLARLSLEGDAPAEPDHRNVVGTPAFMPPEQARGELADARSDVFGLGGLLCVILTGGPPFPGESTMGLIRMSAAGDVAETFARLDACGADPELIALAKRCLNPNPADRPADAAEVARAVSAYRIRLKEPARANPERLPPRIPVSVLVLPIVAVLLLLAVAVALWWPR